MSSLAVPQSAMIRPGKQRDFGEDADRPQHANHAIGDALRPPIEAAEAVVNGVARLD
jgi:hypothetical protein